MAAKKKQKVNPLTMGDMLDPTNPPQPGDSSTRLYANSRDDD